MPANRNETGQKRNKKGQFEKGVSGNPSGRPKKPVNAHEYGIRAYDRIAEMAESSENERIKFDANKWLAEMAFGKPAQLSEIEGSLDTGAITVRLEGEIAEWAK